MGPCLTLHSACVSVPARHPFHGRLPTIPPQCRRMLPAAHASPGWRHALCGFPLLPAPTLSSPAHSCLILRPVCRTFPRTHPAPRPEGALPQPFFDENTFHNQRLRPCPSTPHHSACTRLSCPSACTTPSCPYHAHPHLTPPCLASRLSPLAVTLAFACWVFASRALAQRFHCLPNRFFPDIE